MLRAGGADVGYVRVFGSGTDVVGLKAIEPVLASDWRVFSRLGQTGRWDVHVNAPFKGTETDPLT